MSRYKQLYHDISLDGPLGDCVTIQSLYRDKRTVGWACHDTIEYIVTGEQEARPLGCVAIQPATQPAKPRYGRASARQGLRHSRLGLRYDQARLRHGRC